MQLPPTNRITMQSNWNKIVEKPPPNYEQIPPPPPAIPLSDPHPTGDTVTPYQCAVHLKFLAALADLQDSVANSDGLFGLYDSDAERFQESSNEARARIREKRWAVYTARAVDRYTKWWDSSRFTYGDRPTTTTIRQTEYEQITGCRSQIRWSKSNMPPLGKLIW